MGIVLRRYCEILFSNIILSSIMVVLYELGIFFSQRFFELFLTITVTIYIIVNFWFMRRCYFFLSNRNMYYICDYMAYIIFFISNMLAFFFFDESVYRWLFLITKFGNLFNERFAVFYSIMFFHIIMLVLIAFAPVGMGWLLVYRNEEKWLYEVYYTDDEH